MDQARQAGTYLHDTVLSNQKALGRSMTESEILALRLNPDVAIEAAADYANANLRQLDKIYDTSVLNDVDKAKVIYLAHHEGVSGANIMISNGGSMSASQYDAWAQGKFGVNVKGTAATTQLMKYGNDYSDAYRGWLNWYVDDHIKPQRYDLRSGEPRDMKVIANDLNRNRRR